MSSKEAKVNGVQNLNLNELTTRELMLHVAKRYNQITRINLHLALEQAGDIELLEGDFKNVWSQLSFCVKELHRRLQLHFEKEEKYIFP